MLTPYSYSRDRGLSASLGTKSATIPLLSCGASKMTVSFSEMVVVWASCCGLGILLWSGHPARPCLRFRCLIAYSLPLLSAPSVPVPVHSQSVVEPDLVSEL